MYIESIDFFTTIISTVVTNYLVLGGDDYNRLVSLNNVNLSIDGLLIFTSSAIGFQITNS